ncbi:hypothetical protein ACH5RR_029832 [Cinchona calisaya]|uniref:Uncharacterized protein n=1 Tax=Cinchona calisaya TaxID=153742 RepID=A0ABD2YV34_9GENT
MACWQQLTLTASASATNWRREGMPSLSVSSHALSTYVESNPPQRKSIEHCLNANDTTNLRMSMSTYIEFNPPHRKSIQQCLNANDTMNPRMSIGNWIQNLHKLPPFSNSNSP